MLSITIEDTENKKFPNIEIKRKGINQKTLKKLHNNEFDIHVNPFDYLFTRKYTYVNDRDIYSVELSMPVLKCMFHHSKLPSVDEYDSLFSLDQHIFMIAYGELVVNHVKSQIQNQVSSIDSLVKLIFSYTCQHVVDSFHLIKNHNQLECEHHVKNFDYLHNDYSIIQSNLNESILTRSYTPFKSANEALVREEKDAKEKLNLVNFQLQSSKRKLSELNGQIDKTVLTYNEIYISSTTKLLQETMRMTMYSDSPSSEQLNTNWKTVNWYYQSCDHDARYAFATCFEACFTRCDSEYEKELTTQDYTYMRTGFNKVVEYKSSSKKYIIKFMPTSELKEGYITTQKNINTEKVRVLRKKYQTDIWNSIKKFHIVQPSHFSKLIDTLEAYPPVNGAQTYLQHTSDELIKDLFYNSSTKTSGKSMKWYSETKNCNLVIQKLEFVMNSCLIEKFLTCRKQSSSSMCLFGFHGTRATHPHTVISNGLDPRYSSNPTGLFLGQAAYISLSAYYCHVNNYSYRTADPNTYQLIVVCFLPGIPYHEDSPSSRIASSRRIAPESKDTVTCIADDTRIWALYDNITAYPMYLLTYTI